MRKDLILLGLITILLSVNCSLSRDSSIVGEEITPRNDLIFPNPFRPAPFAFYSIDVEFDPISETYVETLRRESSGISNSPYGYMSQLYAFTGIKLTHLWFEERKMYVNLHEDELAIFKELDSSGSLMRVTMLEKNILLLMRAQSGIHFERSFEVLVNGQRGVIGDNFDFSQIAIVENGEIVRRVPID